MSVLKRPLQSGTARAGPEPLWCANFFSPPSAWVFVTDQGPQLAADNLRKKLLQPACKRAGLQRTAWHPIRHRPGGLLHSQRIPLKVAQVQLGDSSSFASVQRTASSPPFSTLRLYRFRTSGQSRNPNRRPNWRRHKLSASYGSGEYQTVLSGIESLDHLWTLQTVWRKVS